MRASAIAGVLILSWVWPVASAQQTPAEALIEGGHWKRARAIVEARFKEAPDDALANFLLSQIHNAFGDRTTPLPLAEKAVALDGRTAKYHRQLAEVMGVTAQHANPIQQLMLARRFKSEIKIALSLDPKDRQALRDQVEFYLLAPGIAGGDLRRAGEVAARLSEVDAVEGLLARARIAAVRKDAAAEQDLLRQAAEARPAGYRAAVALAEFHLGRGELRAAEAPGAAAVQIEPHRAEGYAILAVAYAGGSQWDKLDAILAASSREVPDDLTAYYRAAERLVSVDPVRAERYIRVYLGQEPEGNEPTAQDANRILSRIQHAHGGASSHP
jgi:hypothetical protein